MNDLYVPVEAMVAMLSSALVMCVCLFHMWKRSEEKRKDIERYLAAEIANMCRRCLEDALHEEHKRVALEERIANLERVPRRGGRARVPPMSMGGPYR